MLLCRLFSAMSSQNQRKLRVMIITMGGERESQMRDLFAQHSVAKYFEPPIFSPGIPSRSLRNRKECLRYAHMAGLIPDGQEWTALEQAINDPNFPKENAATFFDCLKDISVTPGRRGSQEDVKIHYSCEFWRKAKSLNRGRAVLACFLAHLIAMKEFVAQEMDVLMEDNVRMPIHDAAQRIWGGIQASEEWCQRDNMQCHFRYVGFLGSVTNLRWMYQSHIPRTFFRSDPVSVDQISCTVFPFPTTQDMAQDADTHKSTMTDETDRQVAVNDDERHSTPGGNPVWGCYGYWISKDGYDAVINILRKDVGAILWKGKRNRHYHVKPVDKVIPRQILSLFGPSAIHLPSHPAMFRAPMLTSKIHTQWDPEFCKSTEYELAQTGLSWDDLWLTETEKAVVAHYQASGVWLTPKALKETIT